MGNGIGYICKKCKSQKSILYGKGFMFFPKHFQSDNFKKLIETCKEEKLMNIDKLQKFVKNESVVLNKNFEYECYICDQCKYIDNKLKFSLECNDKRFLPKYVCKYCGNSLRLKKKKEEFKIKCDNCGSENFEKETMYINWD